MLECIKLAKKGLGKVSPNPLVGAVIVKNNKIIAKGYHKKFGDKHAEIDALKKAGVKTKGAELYVNLEPCCHYGKTPPCTLSIIKAGIKKVHISVADPNPLVSGKGIKELKKVGIKVVLGERAEESLKLNEVFFKYIKKKEPFVCAKWAMSLDGKIATKTGDSKWITCNKSRELSRYLRFYYKTIIVGVGTVIKDNPRLNFRAFGKKAIPLTIVILDTNGRTPLKSKLFKQKNKIIIATSKKISLEKEKSYLKLGALIWKFKNYKKSVDIRLVLKKLAKEGSSSVFIEGGSCVLGSAFDFGLVDKAFIFMGNKIIGGEKSKTSVAGNGCKYLSESQKWKINKIKKIENDVLIEVDKI